MERAPQMPHDIEVLLKLLLAGQSIVLNLIAAHMLNKHYAHVLEVLSKDQQKQAKSSIEDTHTSSEPE